MRISCLTGATKKSASFNVIELFKRTNKRRNTSDDLTGISVLRIFFRKRISRVRYKQAGKNVIIEFSPSLSTSRTTRKEKKEFGGIRDATTAACAVLPSSVENISLSDTRAMGEDMDIESSPPLQKGMGLDGKQVE
eukprot:jgi/Bigna1/144439/aug1.87_g19147